MKQQTLANMTTQELVSYTETLENIPEDVARELVKRVSGLCEELEEAQGDLEEAERETKDREDDFGGYMEGFIGKLEQAEEMLVEADERYDKHKV